MLPKNTKSYQKLPNVAKRYQSFQTKGFRTVWIVSGQKLITSMKNQWIDTLEVGEGEALNQERANSTPPKLLTGRKVKPLDCPSWTDRLDPHSFHSLLLATVPLPLRPCRDFAPLLPVLESVATSSPQQTIFEFYWLLTHNKINKHAALS